MTRVLVLLLTLAMIACNSAEQGFQAPRPDLSVLAQGADFPEEQRRQLETQIDDPDQAVSGAALGELGMLYHAFGLQNAAVTCYAEAAKRRPEDSRWPYLSGVIHRELGEREQALSAFETAVRLAPDTPVMHVALAEQQLLDNRFDQARSHFETALRLQGDQTAAFIGLGKIAYARGAYAEAVEHFTRALQREPTATSAHYPLSMAYRNLGDEAKAAEHLAMRGEGLPILDDPLLVEVDIMRNDGEAMRLRGNEAAAAGRVAEAMGYYREALAQNPDDARIWLNVGLLHYHRRDLPSSMEANQKAIALSDDATLKVEAHYRLGVIAEDLGRSGRNHFNDALTINPNHAPANFKFAEYLRLEGALTDAITFYEVTIRQRPANAPARMGRALSLIAAKRWADAKTALEEDIKVVTNQAAFPHLLARLLAAAPLDDVRDGARAQQLMTQIPKTAPSTLATLAMAQAENGDFDAAVATQQQAVAMAVEQQQPVETLQRLLLDYSRKRPCRQPWPADDAIFRSRL